MLWRIRTTAENNKNDSFVIGAVSSRKHSRVAICLHRPKSEVESELRCFGNQDPRERFAHPSKGISVARALGS